MNLIMGRTKKVGSAGRFGVRYGLRIRKKVNEIEQKQKKKYECSACHAPRVIRIASGIWQCKKCNHKFANKAYFLEE